MASKTTTMPQTNTMISPRESEQRRQWVNVGMPERWASALGGAGLAAYGLWRRDWLGVALATLGGALLFRGASGHCYVYQTLGIDTDQQPNNTVTSVPHNQGIKIEHAVTINARPEVLYQFWRNFSNLPIFMDNLQSVTVIDSTHSHWVAKAPVGQKVEWDAEIINEKENEFIAWRSVEGSQIGNAGSVHFTPAPAGRGTVVKVVLEYNPPAGPLGALIAKMTGKAPDQQVREELRHFKEVMEAGEVPTIEGQPSGRDSK